MKAPDRLVPDETDVSEFVYYSSGLWTGPEYIRKGAFPVEEIRRQVGVLSQAPKFLQGSDLALFRRILSLLEGQE